MPVEFKDYYRALGVAKDASDTEIKKAYRALAGKYHPDVAKDKAAGEVRFKEVNEANEVLSDPDKRRKYDELSAHWDRPGWQASRQDGGYGGDPGDGAEFHFEGTGFSDFFEQVFGSRGRSSNGFGRATADGMGGDSGARPGRDIEGDILVTLDEVLHGSTRTITLQRSDPRSGQTSLQTLRVKIPPGVLESQMIRLTGKGQEGTHGGTPGNLYLRVAFAKHPDFRVRGSDLYHDLVLSPWEAVLGATIQIPTPDGTVSLKVPPGTVADRQFRLRGKGLPTGTGPRGDLLAIVSLQVPPDLTPGQESLWEQLATQSTFNPRKIP